MSTLQKRLEDHAPNPWTPEVSSFPLYPSMSVLYPTALKPSETLLFNCNCPFIPFCPLSWRGRFILAFDFIFHYSALFWKFSLAFNCFFGENPWIMGLYCRSVWILLFGGLKSYDFVVCSGVHVFIRYSIWVLIWGIWDRMCSFSQRDLCGWASARIDLSLRRLKGTISLSVLGFISSFAVRFEFWFEGFEFCF